MDKRKYTIKDLSVLTGFPVRTIRYYIQQGLIYPPAGGGRGSFYFDSHMERLLEIKNLQDKGLKLTEIQAILQDKSEPKIYKLARRPDEMRELWIRIPVAPGVEISFQRNVEEKEPKKIAELIRVARTILRGGQEDG